MQEYAELNRQVTLEELAKGMKWKMQESISVCHNYIDKEGILRKGTISAREGEKVVIPINMRMAFCWESEREIRTGIILHRTDQDEFSSEAR